jgi:hypothetical protein
MKNYKININRPRVTTEEIASRSDFDSVLKKLQKPPKPLYKSGWFGAVVAIVAAVVLFYFYAMKDNPISSYVKEENSAVNPADNTFKKVSGPFIAPPLKNLDVPYTTYKISSLTGGKLRYKTGTVLSIPSNLFVDAKGNLLRGEVELRYREMHDAVDFFVSGIPMTYDSAGNRYYFESAGMLDIQAYQNGTPVSMAAGKTIEVEMRSFQNGDYNLYLLDTSMKNWRYEGKNSPRSASDELIATHKKHLPVPVDEGMAQVGPSTQDIPDTATLLQHPALEKIKSELELIGKDIAAMSSKKEIAPRKADPKKYKLDIEVDSAHPELLVYKGIKFEVESKNFSEKYYDIDWESVSLSEVEKGLKYNLRLINGTTDITVLVSPVFDGKNYENAKLEHAKKFQESQLALANKKLEKKRKQQEYEQQLNRLVKEAKKAYKEQLDQQMEEEKRRFAALNAKEKIMRVFNIHGFGIWNCDRPIVHPRGNKVKATFVNADQREIQLNSFYLVEQNTNGIFNYTGRYELSYNPKNRNMFWGITADGKLAVFRYEEFDKIPPVPAPYTFKMEIADREFKSAEEIKSYLDI